MKKDIITEEKAKKSPAGGVLVGKREGQTIIHDKGTQGGYFVGKLHKEGGIKGINKSTGQPIEVQGGEVIITAPAVADQTKREFEGQMLTNREILSKINERGGGVSLENGGEIYYNGSSYNYGGKTMTDYEILQSMNDCGCEHEYDNGGEIKKSEEEENGKIEYFINKRKVGFLDYIFDEKDTISENLPSTFNNEMYIDYIEVDKEFRNLGIAKKLINKAIDIAKDKKIQVITLRRDSGMGSNYGSEYDNYLKNIYQKNGFQDFPDNEEEENTAMYYVFDKNKKFNRGGSLSKGKSLEDIAKMHKVSVSHIKKELAKGRKVESEHTSNKKEQERIAKDHLVENPNYYTILDEVGLKKGGIADSSPNSIDDVLDIHADGVFGGENGIMLGEAVGGADASFSDGGSLDFLDEAVKKFDDGGATKELVEYIEIWNTGGLLRSLIGNTYRNYKDLKKDLEEINPRYSYMYLAPNGKTMGSSIDVKKDGKNTVRTINPTTSKAKDFEKAIKRSWGEWRFEKYDLSKWLQDEGKGKRKSKPQPKPEPKKELITDLNNTKIWIGDNPELSERIQELAIKQGFDWYGGNGKPKYNVSTGLFFYKNTFNEGIIVTTENKKIFDSSVQYKEIFESDLFGEEEPKKPEPKKSIDLNGKHFWIYSDKGLAEKVVKRAEELGFYDTDSIKGKIERNDIPKYLFFSGSYVGWGDDNPLGRQVLYTDLFGEEEPKKPQPEPIKEEVKIDFEATRKYLTLRIADLTKELNFKKPRLSNEEIGFYQRDINELIFKLRKINEKELDFFPIKDRLQSAYSLKWGDINAEYKPSEDLLASNGLPTKLTDLEWVNVRTDYFSSFFGDWRLANETGDFSGVSKVIDPETKEPMPVYHGTNVLFTEWKTYKTNNAHYFAKNRDFSQWFAEQWSKGRGDISAKDSNLLKQLNPNKGEYLYRCFLDIKNPIDFSRFGVEKRPVSDFLMFLQINYNIGDFDFWTNFRLFNNLAQDTLVYSWMIIRNWQSFTEYIKMATTYDGYIFYEYHPEKEGTGLDGASLSFCAFDSSQIKFTNATEFNALITDSRFEKGGKL